MNWLLRLKLKKISTIAIILSLIMSITFAGFTIYGNEVGNFVVGVDKNNSVNIALSEFDDLSNLTSRLVVSGVAEQNLATLSDIPLDIAQGVGSKNDNLTRKYLAFSFYLVNKSERSVDYTMSVIVDKATQNVDSAIRFMLIEGNNERGDIYAKAKEAPDLDVGQPENYPYMTKPFADSKVILSNTVTSFQVGESTKYTFVMWLEGWDSQGDDRIKGASLKLSLNFYGY